MKIIKAEHNREIAIPGVPGLVRRPVDIDRSRTGFTNLRSLRVYRFDAGVTIDGHAEEDEVFVVVMAGSIELTVTGDNSGEEPRSLTLSAANNSDAHPCAAYLPPHSAYQLTPKTDAEVAYARATPPSGRPSRLFTPAGRMEAPGVTVLLQEKTYAQRLRLRLLHINATQGEVDLTPLREPDDKSETLVHFRTVPLEGAATISTVEGGAILLDSWDTVALAPGNLPTLHIALRSAVLILIVEAI